MISLKILVITIVTSLLLGLGAGGFIGYEMTLSRALTAEASLALLKKEGDIAEKQHAKNIELLKYEVSQVQSKAKAELQIVEAGLKEYKSTQTSLLAKRDSEISNLKTLVGAGQENLSSLKEALSLAKTESEKHELEAKILLQEKEILASQVRASGLECLTVPIPEEYVKNINSI